MRQKEKKKASKAGNKDLDNSGLEHTKIVPIENSSASEEQVKPFVKKIKIISLKFCLVILSCTTSFRCV